MPRELWLSPRIFSGDQHDFIADPAWSQAGFHGGVAAVSPSCRFGSFSSGENKNRKWKALGGGGKRGKRRRREERAAVLQDETIMKLDGISEGTHFPSRPLFSAPSEACYLAMLETDAILIGIVLFVLLSFKLTRREHKIAFRDR